MTIIPITDKSPACLGVMCPQHKDCQRYHLVETIGSWNAIGTCHDSQDEYPHFLPIASKEPA